MPEPKKPRTTGSARWWWRRQSLISLIASLLFFGLAPLALAQLNPVPVGSYLYANPEALQGYSGSLRVEFTDDAPGRTVLAYGRRYRKDRHSRSDTTETEREIFKPIKATTTANGTVATFPHLPPDYYDLLVIDDQKMTLHEGLRLMTDPVEFSKTKHDTFFQEVSDSLSTTTERIGGWEAFFDSKDFLRLETDGMDGVVLVQQMRKGKAYAESGDLLQGTVHSIDICWVRRAKHDVGWQVITRQQFYRNELANQDWFRHTCQPDLNGIRIGNRAKTIGPINITGR